MDHASVSADTFIVSDCLKNISNTNFMLCQMLVYSTYTPVFTDGSKENNKAALAVIFPAKVYSQKLPYGTSIYTAELLAIREALQYISKFSIKTSIIFTDSLSALQSLESQKLHQSLILSILTIIHHLHLKNYDVVFCWIPSHIGITGNEKADHAAKSALNLSTSLPTHYHIPISHLLKNTYSPGGNTFGIIQLVINSITSILLSLLIVTIPKLS